MNNQLKDLVHQAGTDCSGKWMAPHHTEKLAELIVQKCIDMIEIKALQHNEPVWTIELINSIKQHFGVTNG